MADLAEELKAEKEGKLIKKEEKPKRQMPSYEDGSEEPEKVE